jgi:predicted nucleic acid-binding protein
MVLVDTSVWIDHLRKDNSRLSDLLHQSRVLIHPFIIGELSCGNLKNRTTLLHLLNSLPRSVEATHNEVFTLVESRNLSGRGIGWIDAHLLASALLSAADLWTLDKRLARIYTDLTKRSD